jgi:hypothetical protein
LIRQNAGAGAPRHLLFLHEVFNKLNSYTTRLVKHQQIGLRSARIISAIGAFFKWYLFSGAWRQGKVGVVTGCMPRLQLLKYLKPGIASGEKRARCE